ncbi:hypothetical protein TIFTF001_024291 [Ficus carica]|uniref:Protein TAPETUM DETERMINANT 1 n=1 Tax=Ficus carica TaxID=3494 RepID=A0AA88AVL0_FICCA|nr:hypothetical protein TIFTF001_024291 [Ficus carica]
MMSYSHVCILYLAVLMITLCNHGILSGPSQTALHSFHGDSNHSATMELEHEHPNNSSHRKLLAHGRCTSRDISISQSRDATISGIPEYIVQIVNTCVCGSGASAASAAAACAVSEIHVHCGWFASTRMINPTTFKRLSYDDCLVNGGRPLKSSHIISFTYSNSFMYPLSLRFAKFS